jgi:sirohydrochlorin cobaltochelatase
MVRASRPGRSSGSEARLVLFAHGSGDRRWRDPFEALRVEVARSCGDAAVRLAYMEFAEPTLLDVAAEAARDGIRTLRVLPLFMAGGAHLNRDLPEQVERIRALHPELVVEILPAVGEDARFQALLREIACDAL